MDTRLALIEERTSVLPDYHHRLLNLEKWKERMVGISMTIGALSGLITALIVWILTKVFQ